MEMITGNGVPSKHLVGAVGQYYKDLNTGDIYECKCASKFSILHREPVGGYVWKKIARGEHMNVCAGGDSGGGWDAVIEVDHLDGDFFMSEITADKCSLAKGTFAELWAKYSAGDVPQIALVVKEFYNSEYYSVMHAYSVLAKEDGIYCHFMSNYAGGDNVGAPDCWLCICISEGGISAASGQQA